MSKLDNIRRYNERRREKGLCIACSKPAKKGSSYCGECLKKRRIMTKKNRQNKRFKYQDEKNKKD